MHVLFACASVPALPHYASAVKTGELELRVIDAKSHEPIPARLRIFNAQGRPPRIRNVVRQGLDFTFDGPLTITLKPGRYTFTLDHGPHYRQRTGYLDVDRDGVDQKTLALPRFADLRQEGWYGGDMFLTRRASDLRLLAAAEELDLVVAPVWRSGEALTAAQLNLDRNLRDLESSLADYSGGLVDTPSGSLVTANHSQDVDPTTLAGTLFDAATSLRQGSAHLALLDANAWDMPLLVAHDLVDSIAVLNSSQRLQGDATSSRQQRGSKQPHHQLIGGMGSYSMETYFRLLNCGLRISPSACSGSGECDNPPGYNRVYVACGQDFSAETWYRNLARGRVIISNGPLLRVHMNDESPGHTFEANAGGEVTLDVTCKLATRQKVEYLEIIKNGRVIESVRLDEWAANGGKLPLVTFRESGWVAIRAVAESDKGFRGAMTGPFFVSIGGAPRISKADAEYFVEWVFDRARQVRSQTLPEEEIKRQLEPHRRARDFWQQLVDGSNAP